MSNAEANNCTLPRNAIVFVSRITGGVSSSTGTATTKPKPPIYVYILIIVGKVTSVCKKDNRLSLNSNPDHLVFVPVSMDLGMAREHEAEGLTHLHLSTSHSK